MPQGNIKMRKLKADDYISLLNSIKLDENFKDRAIHSVGISLPNEAYVIFSGSYLKSYRLDENFGWIEIVGGFWEKDE